MLWWKCSVVQGARWGEKVTRGLLRLSGRNLLLSGKTYDNWNGGQGTSGNTLVLLAPFNLHRLFNDSNQPKSKKLEIHRTTIEWSWRLSLTDLFSSGLVGITTWENKSQNSGILVEGRSSFLVAGLNTAFYQTCIAPETRTWAIPDVCICYIKVYTSFYSCWIYRKVNHWPGIWFLGMIYTNPYMY